MTHHTEFTVADATTLTPEVPAAEALEWMDVQGVDSLLVCTPSGRPLGVVNREDLLPYVYTDTAVGILRRP